MSVSLRRAGVLAAIAALAVWLRASTWEMVFQSGYAMPTLTDSVYHLRRALEAAAHQLRVPTHDPLLNWPHGGDCLWAPGFDVLLALPAFVLGLGNDAVAAANVIVWVPVMLGLVVLLGVAAVARRLSPTQTADHDSLLAILLCATLPICIFTASLGRTDHHVAEALSVLGLCAWVQDRFPLDAFRALSRRDRWWFELRGAALFGFAFFVFAGSALYAALALAPLLIAMLCESTTAERRWPLLVGSGAIAALGGALLTLVLYLPGMLVHRRFLTFEFASLLQPSLLALGGVGLLLAACAARVLHAGSASGRLIALRSLATGALSLIPALALLPVMRELWAGVQQMLIGKGTRSAALVGQILEFQPLVRVESAFEPAAWDQAFRYFGPLALAGFVLLPLAVRAAARVSRARALVFAWWVAALMLLTFRQSRFARELGPLLAVGALLGLRELVAVLCRGGAGLQAQRLATIACAVLLAFAPSATRARLLPPAESKLSGMQEASVYLARAAPSQAHGRRVGALVDWNAASFLLWPARIPVVANSLGPSVDATSFWQTEEALTGSEREALAFMQQRELRWFASHARYFTSIVLKGTGARAIVTGPHGKPVLNLQFLQGVPLAASMVGGGGIPGAGIAHLAHLAPRWASAETVEGLGFFVPTVWIYEAVPGALLQGQAEPQSTVVARIALSARGHVLPYTAWTRAAEDGRFALRVPLATSQRDETVTTGDAWQVEMLDHPGRRIAIQAPARGVLEGASFVVGDLRSTPAP